MKITIKLNKNVDILFWISYGLYLVSEILNLTFYSRYFIGITLTIIRVAVVSMLALREFIIREYDKRSLAIGIIFIILAFVSWTQTSASSLVFILIFLFCARNIDFMDIAKFSVWIISFLLVFVIISSYIGIIQNYVYVSSTRVRHYLGFRYSLYPSALLFNVSALILYIKKTQIHWLEILLLTVVNFWMFNQTNSRLSFYLVMALILVFACMKLYPNMFKKHHIICWIMVLSFVICLIISFYITIMYDPNVELERQLNSFLGNRLYLGQISLKNEGITMWGREFILVGNSLDAYGNIIVSNEQYLYVDSYYIQFVQRYGIVLSVIWFGILTVVMYRCYKAQDYCLLVCMSFIAFRFIIDDTFGKLYYNTFWFVVILFLMDKNKISKVKTNSGI